MKQYVKLMRFYFPSKLLSSETEDFFICFHFYHANGLSPLKVFFTMLNCLIASSTPRPLIDKSNVKVCSPVDWTLCFAFFFVSIRTSTLIKHCTKIQLITPLYRACRWPSVTFFTFSPHRHCAEHGEQFNIFRNSTYCYSSI